MRKTFQGDVKVGRRPEFRRFCLAIACSYLLLGLLPLLAPALRGLDAAGSRVQIRPTAG